MVPDVAQQVRAVRQMMAKTVVPSIDVRDGFAQEQAGLVLATLDWILDVEEEQERYLRVEMLDQSALLEALRGLAGRSSDAAPEPLPGGSSVAVLRSRVKDLKARTTRLFEELTAADGTVADQACALLDKYGRRQLERELSWARMTGFPEGSAASITSVLDTHHEEAK